MKQKHWYDLSYKEREELKKEWLSSAWCRNASNEIKNKLELDLSQDNNIDNSEAKKSRFIIIGIISIFALPIFLVLNIHIFIISFGIISFVLIMEALKADKRNSEKRIENIKINQKIQIYNQLMSEEFVKWLLDKHNIVHKDFAYYDKNLKI